jgi:5-methyltetrahydropteroyltriglutamate--homocysteine methyltransferase
MPSEIEEKHPYPAAASFDGGDLDCGNGLLLLIRKHIDPLPPGALLEIRSTDTSVAEDLPSWCRLTNNALVSVVRRGKERSFLVSKGPKPDLSATPARVREHAPITQPIKAVIIPRTFPAPMKVAPIAPLSVMGIGSWPRPRWMLQAIHEHLEGRLDDEAFEETARDAVKLAIDAQLQAGVDVITDGEQRRDNYASFVGGLLDNTQLVPITDLLPYVDDPEKFAEELRALDVPASSVRHPAVFGPLGRSRPLAVQELLTARSMTDRPIKIALPGPYLLTRTMWMECISDRAYETREALSVDIVRVLREEIHELLAAGASLVQLDEPVLTEVVFAPVNREGGRTFMCGALGARRAPDEELAFAEELLRKVSEGIPRDRLALHVCRGNWTPDESVALTGDYRPLLPLLSRVPVGTLFLESCTTRAGDERVLAELPENVRVGVGVVNQKSRDVESVDEIVAKAERMIALLGVSRVLLNPDCGFATFADNPIASADLARRKLAAIVEASRRLREKHIGSRL